MIERTMESPNPTPSFAECVAAEERCRIDLQRPAPLCELVREHRSVDHRFRSFWMRDERTQSSRFSEFRERDELVGRTDEGNLHQYELGSFEHVAVRVLVEQRARWS